MTLLLDMDEVIVDFVGGACQAHGITRENLEAIRAGKWSLADSLDISLEQFWRPINERGIAFWTSLHMTPWGGELLKGVCRKWDNDWFLITDPSYRYCPYAYQGKLEWIRNQFGERFDRFFITPYKHLLARPDRLLIDDNPDNCRRFAEHGGRAQLFPSTGNRLYPWANNPLTNPGVYYALKIP